MSGQTDAEVDAVCRRYRTGSALAQNLGSEIDRDEAYSVIRSMAVDGWTMWTSMYNLNTGDFSVTYKSAFEHPHRGRIPRSSSDDEP